MIFAKKIHLKTRSGLFHLLPVIIWTAVILLLTGIPKDSIPKTPEFLDLFQPDKIVHLLMFSIYVYLFNRNGSKAFPEKDRNVIFWVAILSGVLYGGLTELMQKYIFISRNCSVYDIIANTAGCLAGGAILKIRNRKTAGQNENS